MVAPTLVAHGTDELRARYLRPIFTGEEVWCQLFSEPGSGSDLAGLSTTVVGDGDQWSITGQKVWTSFAHIADRALCLARSDVEAPKHRGLTYFIVDMHAAGVEVRPLRELTGEAQFSEVFLTDVAVADDHRVGAVGDGWRASMSTLASERAGMGEAPLGSAAMGDALEAWAEVAVHDPVRRDRLVAFWVRSEAYRLLNLKAQQQRQSGRPGPEGSLAKLACAELGQELYEFCMELHGADGMLHPDAYAPRRVERGERLLAGRDVHWLFLRSRGFTIEGGTAQIQRNVIGERILGLPADISVDREIPWRSIHRG
jgi:alkylation response protein AidB-like acyl-CoA dehydrogenase